MKETKSIRNSESDLRSSVISGPNTNNYQRGSHPLMNQILDMANTIEVYILIKSNYCHIGRI